MHGLSGAPTVEGAMASIAGLLKRAVRYSHSSSLAHAKRDTEQPSKLQKYSWHAPKHIESTSVQDTRRDKPQSGETTGKKQKPPYRPPSSLDRDGQEPLHSDLPFDFQFSYSEQSPSMKPLGFREPKFSPFGPGRLDREWTGFSAPLRNPTVTSVDGHDHVQAELKSNGIERKSSAEILGEPLSRDEIQLLVEKNRRQKTKRQVNIGRDGLTHNMLNDIHNHWKHAEAVRIKCLGVPTIDMKNICFHLEDKTGGKIIYRNSGLIILYRGRHYKPKERPAIPLMLWKPHEPIYARLIKTTIEGLTVAETKEMRKKGLNIPALTKLKKNGVYCELVHKVQEAFSQNELVRIDCTGLPTSDYKKIGVKLRDLVPCVLVTFEKEQIVIWRGKNSTFGKALSSVQVSDIGSLDRTNSVMLVKESALVPLEVYSKVFLSLKV